MRGFDNVKGVKKFTQTSDVCMAIQTLLENSTTEAWSEQMEDDARIVEALKQNELRGVHPRVSKKLH